MGPIGEICKPVCFLYKKKKNPWKHSQFCFLIAQMRKQIKLSTSGACQLHFTQIMDENTEALDSKTNTGLKTSTD